MGTELQEIGGYIGLDKCTAQRLHESAIALNSGRSCLAYLIRTKAIQCIWLPYFVCGSVCHTCQKEGVHIRYYHIGKDFLPQDVNLQDKEWLYLVNYYGQISNERIALLVKRYKRVIVDSAQAYFQQPLERVDTLYSCRKFFGVPDGGMLYTDTAFKEGLERDYSYERMRHLLGSFEKKASEFYREYVINNQSFAQAPILRMSLLTDNLLRALDYNDIKKKRTSNFRLLDCLLREKNILKLELAEGAYMYPFWIEDGGVVRKELIQKRIYIPILWPDVLEMCGQDTIEYQMAQNILPLPVDQRYGEKEMRYIAKCILDWRK
ncbi:MAG: hypothetical protein HFI03_07235 [Lachnospiraceae bacterium]|jgi:hypothetical protein|nr:hypothetical protein [Lachnospiraceae bacterium]